MAIPPRLEEGPLIVDCCRFHIVTVVEDEHPRLLSASLSEGEFVTDQTLSHVPAEACGEDPAARAIAERTYAVLLENHAKRAEGLEEIPLDCIEAQVAVMQLETSPSIVGSAQNEGPDTGVATIGSDESNRVLF
jgi:hypothetical protein